MGLREKAWKSPLRSRARLAAIRVCQRGAVAVEAALVVPVLVSLVFGAMEYGMMLFTYSAMQSAGREVTRQIAVNYTAPADAQTLIRSRLPSWSAGATTVRVAQSAPGDPTANVIDVTITVPARTATPLHFFTTIGGDWTLSTEVRMKQEVPL